MYIQTQQARARENGLYYVCNWDSLLQASIVLIPHTFLSCQIFPHSNYEMKFVEGQEYDYSATAMFVAAICFFSASPNNCASLM